jgi:hypothetical protein
MRERELAADNKKRISSDSSFRFHSNPNPMAGMGTNRSTEWSRTVNQPLLSAQIDTGSSGKRPVARKLDRWESAVEKISFDFHHPSV